MVQALLRLQQPPVIDLIHSRLKRQRERLLPIMLDLPLSELVMHGDQSALPLFMLSFEVRLEVKAILEDQGEELVDLGAN